MSYSPFTHRFQKKLGLEEKLMRRLTLRDCVAIERAFVAALKEEVEARFGPETQPADPLAFTPLVIAGLGSFKMRTRPQRTFHKVPGVLSPHEPFVKPPARRLVFKSKWEEIK